MSQDIRFIVLVKVTSSLPVMIVLALSFVDPRLGFYAWFVCSLVGIIWKANADGVRFVPRAGRHLFWLVIGGPITLTILLLMRPKRPEEKVEPVATVQTVVPLATNTSPAGD